MNQCYDALKPITSNHKKVLGSKAKNFLS